MKPLDIDFQIVTVYGKKLWRPENFPQWPSCALSPTSVPLRPFLHMTLPFKYSSPHRFIKSKLLKPWLLIYKSIPSFSVNHLWPKGFWESEGTPRHGDAGRISNICLTVVCQTSPVRGSVCLGSQAHFAPLPTSGQRPCVASGCFLSPGARGTCCEGWRGASHKWGQNKTPANSPEGLNSCLLDASVSLSPRTFWWHPS